MFQCLVANEVGEDITDTWLQVQGMCEGVSVRLLKALCTKLGYNVNTFTLCS